MPLRGGTGLGKPLKLILHPLRREIPIYMGAEGRRTSRCARRSRTAGCRCSSRRSGCSRSRPRSPPRSRASRSLRR
jgi:hypothetical protein